LNRFSTSITLNFEEDVSFLTVKELIFFLFRRAKATVSGEVRSIKGAGFAGPTKIRNLPLIFAPLEVERGEKNPQIWMKE